MVGEKFVSEAVVESQAIEIVFAAQNQIVKLRQEITQARFHIEAAEIEAVITAVVKILLPGIEIGVERLSDPRLIISRRHWRYDDVAHFAAPGQRDIRRVENWSPERNRERL